VDVSKMPRDPRVLLPALACVACFTAAIGVATGCFVVPPPDLPAPIIPPPEIQLASVVPPAELMESWPADGFRVPIMTFASNENCVFSVFNDSDAVFCNRQCDEVIFDAGVFVQPFEFQETDDTVPHTILFVVAEAFDQIPKTNNCLAPNSAGADTVTWSYVPPSALYYDAGIVADGAFPDVPLDGILVVPESGPSSDAGDP
jgi:hypothetical protein